MKKASPPNMNYAWTEVMVRELVRLGVEHFFIAPGSRSSPLALAAAEFGINSSVHFDERGLGFAALGHARATGKPAVVITTSGTAVANLMPAVCEASQDDVPMLILSADRPPELRGTCANQTMNQVYLFGDYVRWFVDMPCPDKNMSAESLLSTVDHAYQRAVSGHPGPVHLNQMLREPLTPDKVSDGAAAWFSNADRWLKSSKPFSRCLPSRISAEDLDMLDVADQLANAKRGLIVVGALSDEDALEAANEIARRLLWPVIPDIRSGLRIGKANSRVIQFADQVLLSKKFSDKHQADVILHFGGRITSKRVQQYIGACGAAVIMVNPSPVRMVQGAVPTVRIHAHVDAFSVQLPSFATQTEASWAMKWQKANNAAQNVWSAMIDKQKPVTEPLVAAHVSRLIPDDHALILASSMPVRDMEMYGLRSKKLITVTSNRGVSGIDGTVATAVGYAMGSKQPVTLVIGDLALLHDLNSLALIKASQYAVHIVIINNDGGGIFSLLPIAAIPSNYEKCFGTPHGMHFENSAAMFGIDYAAPGNAEEFIKAYKTAVKKGCGGMIEVKTNRSENAAEHRRIQKLIKKAVDHVIG